MKDDTSTREHIASLQKEYDELDMQNSGICDKVLFSLPRIEALAAVDRQIKMLNLFITIHELRETIQECSDEEDSESAELINRAKYLINNMYVVKKAINKVCKE
jgi:K+/H+ antiporter YhaU regulatory subunit KhtT